MIVNCPSGRGQRCLQNPPLLRPPPKTLNCLLKSLPRRWGLSPLLFVPHQNHQFLLLKTTQGLIEGHGEIKLEPSLKLPPCRPSYVVLEGGMKAVGLEKSSTVLLFYRPKLKSSMFPPVNSAMNVLIHYFLIWIMLEKRHSWYCKPGQDAVAERW